MHRGISDVLDRQQIQPTLFAMPLPRLGYDMPVSHGKQWYFVCIRFATFVLGMT